MKFISRLRKGSQDDDPHPFLFIGLGNPGSGFQDNRHNIGFMVVDEIAERLGEKFSRVQGQALVTKSRYEGHQIILAKPRTYMNLSGHSAGTLVRFYKLSPDNLLVIYDDIDLPIETIRLRAEGGSAGQKGIRSIIEHLGTQSFPRLRVGVGRPKGKRSASSHVLQNFSKAERKILPFVLARSADAALTFVSYGIDHAMNKYNQRPG